MTRHIDLRGDQVLFNHGPGSILETTSGPVVVGNFGLLEGRINRITAGGLQFPLDFEVLESRLAQLLPRGEGGHIPRLHRVPSNQELDSNSDFVMSTRNSQTGTYAGTQATRTASSTYSKGVLGAQSVPMMSSTPPSGSCHTAGMGTWTTSIGTGQCTVGESYAKEQHTDGRRHRRR